MAADNYLERCGVSAFFGGDYHLRLPQSSIILFRSNFMFPHEILEVTGGTRHAVVTWMI